MTLQTLFVLLVLSFPAFIVSQGDRTRLRVVHTIPSAPAVDIFANDIPTSIKTLNFYEASEYITLPAGIWDITATVTGCRDQLLLTKTFELVSHTTYTLLLQRDGTTGAPVFNLKIDDNTFPKDQYAAVRFIHSSPVTPSFPITLVANGVPVFSNYVYGQASPYQVFPAGVYNLSFTITQPVKTVLTTVYDVSLSSRSVYTVYALGLESITASLTEDSGAYSVPDPCADCPCGNSNAFSTSSELQFIFDGLVPQQTACCTGA